MENLVLKDPVVLLTKGGVEVYVGKSDFILKRKNCPSQCHIKGSEHYSEVHDLQALLKFLN
jgi:hypothetical protein